MKRVLIASDSFKGTLSSSEIISLCSKVVREKFSSEISLSSLLIADGGEGSLDAICSFLQGERIQTKAIDSCERMIETEYFYQREEKTAFIEVAKVLSLPHVDPSFPKRKRTTRGVGMLIRDAIQKGAKRIYLFLGGTSTNDFGISLLEELGVKFNVSHVSAESLLEITDFSTEAFDSLIQGVEFIGLSDVENPLLGNQGATYVFGPQKGYSKDLCLLEEGMSHFASLIKEKKGIDVSFQKGAGAAGGLGACILSFFHGKLQSGIDTMLNLASFDEKAKDADFVITGEGTFDTQSLHGKAVSGILSRTDLKKVIILCGINRLENSSFVIYETSKRGLSFSEIQKRAKDSYSTAFEKAIREVILK